jgi:hypothetical protein
MEESKDKSSSFRTAAPLADNSGSSKDNTERAYWALEEAQGNLLKSERRPTDLDMYYFVFLYISHFLKIFCENSTSHIKTRNTDFENSEVMSSRDWFSLLGY